MDSHTATLCERMDKNNTCSWLDDWPSPSSISRPSFNSTWPKSLYGRLLTPWNPHWFNCTKRLRSEKIYVVETVQCGDDVGYDIEIKSVLLPFVGSFEEFFSARFLTSIVIVRSGCYLGSRFHK